MSMVVEIDQSKVRQIAASLAQEQRERLHRARVAGRATLQVEAVDPTARIAVPGKSAWPGGPLRPTFETDPDHRTVELPQIERYDVRITRTATLVEEEVRRFWYAHSKRPDVVYMSALRLLTIRSAHWARYPVLLIGSTLIVALRSDVTLGDDEMQAAIGIENPTFYLYTMQKKKLA